MKKIKGFLLGLLIATLLISGQSKVALGVGLPSVKRLSGSNSIRTSMAVSKEVYKGGADTVILAGRNGQADALTGTLLSKEKNAPLLLVNKDRLDDYLLDHIKALRAKKVYILGGEGVVSKAVENKLKSENFNVERLNGKNRRETAVEIAKEVFGNTVPKEAFIIENNSLVDALSIGSIAAEKRAPILITKGDEVPSETKKAIEDFKIQKATIVGGETTVTSKGKKALENSIGDVGRVSGKDRVETALAVANKYNPNSTDVILSNKRQLSDALVGGYLSARTNAPILLIDKDSVSNNVKAKIKKAKNTVYILGGTSVVNSQAEKEVKKVLTDIHGYRNGDKEPNDTIANASLLNLNETVTGHIDKKDKDYFKIEVPKEGTLNVSLLSLEENGLSLHLYGEDYEKGSIKGYWSQSKGSISEGLKAGVYYISVAASSSQEESPYELDIDYSPSEYADDNAGDIFIKAEKINLNKKFTGHIGYKSANRVYNENDYYKIEVPKEGTLNLDLLSLQGKGLHLHLYGEDYEKGDIKSVWNSSKININQGLQPGIYYIRVTTYAYTYSPYELNVKFTQSKYKDDNAGDKFVDAKQIKINDKFTGHIGYTKAYNVFNQNDYFKIDVPKKGTLKLDLLSFNDKDISLYLYSKDYQNGTITQSTYRPRHSLSQQLNPGSYYIRVASLGYGEKHSPYELKVRFK